MEALQARWSCASSLDSFTQPLLHCAWPKTRSPESGSRPALIVVAHVFSWPPARLLHVRGSVGRPWSLISSHSGRLAASPNQRSLLCTSSAGVLVRQRRRRTQSLHTRKPYSTAARGEKKFQPFERLTSKYYARWRIFGNHLRKISFLAPISRSHSLAKCAAIRNVTRLRKCLLFVLRNPGQFPDWRVQL